MEEAQLDYVLVPLGLAVMAIYHTWLFYTILYFPKRTVIGLNAYSRRAWVNSMMLDPIKNGVLAVQTLRNNIMASTLLATTAITLSSIISVVVSSSNTTASSIVYGNRTSLASAVKYFALLVCFLVAFLFNVQSIRYYAHVSFLVSSSAKEEGSVEYAARSLNRGSFFWSLGLRAFYFSFPLFLWIFGPIPMFVCCCVLCCLLYFLDSTTHFTRRLHSFSHREDVGGVELESTLPV